MKNNKAFTLIELLVVISIIGVISSIVFVSFSGSRDKARLAKAQNFDAQISHALGAYAVGIWRFESISGGKVSDESGYGNDGTVTGAIIVDSEVYPGTKALNFDGSGDYVDCGGGRGSFDFGTGDFTISFWAKLTTHSDMTGLVYKQNSYWYGSGWAFITPWSPNSVYFRVVGSSSSIELNTGSGSIYDWTHFVGVKNGNNFYIYRNGKQVGNKTKSIGNVTSTSNLFIGKSNYDSYNGQIDNVAIYNEALSSAQIQQHFAASAPAHGIAVNDN